MLERNILSHLKLALLLSLLSSAILLHARLPTPSEDDSGEKPPPSGSKAELPMATLEMVAALAAIAAGVWEYWCGDRDLRNMRAFLVANK